MSIESQLEALRREALPSGIAEGVALGTGLADGYDFYESPIGQVVVTFNPEGVSSVDIIDGFADRYTDRFGRALIRAEAPASWRDDIPVAIERGTPGSLPVDLRSVTNFQRSVLRATATIPKGEVRPYGWVAREIESPRAVRAVGSAVARNPVPLIIPCHRVVRTDGHIGNYSLGGRHNKIDLLEHEGAGPGWLESLADRHVRVRGNPTTKTYHHPTCHVMRSESPAHAVDFRTASDARNEGYQPCPSCRPTG